MQRKPDLALARQHLQWEPTTALEPGLRRTIDCFAAQLARA
jgi:UDP-glucuronate decarboxylase